MTITQFSDAFAAIDEAVFLACQRHIAYALVDVDGETIHVIPLSHAIGLKILEVCNP